MIDIHCHIVPWIDDGAENARTACEMAEHAYRSGVRAIVATPHCALNILRPNLRGKLYNTQIAMFRALLKQHDIPLQILPGCELYASTPNLRYLLENKRIVTLNHSRYLMSEFNFGASAREIDDALGLIARFGYIPVVAHPERYRALQEEPRLAEKWFANGYILQLNKGSLLGRLGAGAERLALHLLHHGLVHVIASDAHDSRYRPTGFQTLLSRLDRYCAPEYIDLMLKINPQRIISDEAIPLPNIADGLLP